MHSGVEILQVEELIERADDRFAKRGSLFFELFDAERVQRPEGRRTLRGRRNLVIRHSSYKQSKRHVPEPEVDVEPELFTQAEIA